MVLKRHVAVSVVLVSDPVHFVPLEMTKYRIHRLPVLRCHIIGERIQVFFFRNGQTVDAARSRGFRGGSALV